MTFAERVAELQDITQAHAETAKFCSGCLEKQASCRWCDPSKGLTNYTHFADGWMRNRSAHSHLNHMLNRRGLRRCLNPTDYTATRVERDGLRQENAVLKEKVANAANWLR